MTPTVSLVPRRGELESQASPPLSVVTSTRLLEYSSDRRNSSITFNNNYLLQCYVTDDIEYE